MTVPTSSDNVGFYLNLAGGAEVLKEMAADRIAEIAETIAGGAGEDAEVTQKVTDRARATVKVPAEQQAKDGVLSRAASAAGLEVVQRKRRPRKSKKAEK
jgi:enoyl reductase-like protein